MASPVIDIRDSGRNTADLASVRLMADNMVHSWTSVTTGTIAVTADTNTDVSFTQPADTIIRNLIAFYKLLTIKEGIWQKIKDY